MSHQRRRRICGSEKGTGKREEHVLPDAICLWLVWLLCGRTLSFKMLPGACGHSCRLACVASGRHQLLVRCRSMEMLGEWDDLLMVIDEEIKEDKALLFAEGVEKQFLR